MQSRAAVLVLAQQAVQALKLSLCWVRALWLGGCQLAPAQWLKGCLPAQPPVGPAGVSLAEPAVSQLSQHRPARPLRCAMADDCSPPGVRCGHGVEFPAGWSAKWWCGAH